MVTETVPRVEGRRSGWDGVRVFAQAYPLGPMTRGVITSPLLSEWREARLPVCLHYQWRPDTGSVFRSKGRRRECIESCSDPLGVTLFS